METMRIFEVGGAVRNRMRGMASKDLDFSVEMRGSFVDAEQAFDTMRNLLEMQGFRVFTENPEFFTLRAHFPVSHEMHGKTTADFVMCRKDGPSSDGRRPDFVLAGTLADDLARRDFTVNAIAVDAEGNVIDPHNGVRDLEANILHGVGDCTERFREDSLRSLRAIRFHVTKGFDLGADVLAALQDTELPNLLAAVSTERVRDELEKCFKFDTLATLDAICHTVPVALRDAMFANGALRLSATQKK